MNIHIGAVATAAVLATLYTAPAAHADESSYLNAMHQPHGVIDMYVTDSQLLQLGYVACKTMANGQSMGQAHTTVAQTAVAMGLSPNMGTVNSIVNQASNYLC